jgi:hypothetical protein
MPAVARSGATLVKTHLEGFVPVNDPCENLSPGTGVRRALPDERNIVFSMA